MLAHPSPHSPKPRFKVRIIAPLSYRVHQLEQQIAGADAEVTDLVNDKERGTAEKADVFSQGPSGSTLGKRFDQVSKRREVKDTLINVIF